ncbi:DUF4249 domain-containing protein [Flagellimonas sp. 389]|uniref:DUF4249 domain-containing protein n=1 Tax=Flagellimonas sp. 389 TaxID=2835862 RepID=UPI001BD6ABB2|nr:DUF4249 domain-containing protein [Flagellimonas sp. 389]MBS9463466.1 DUF4249 domain-containing protein [Flagellimonas sp. 389]
MVAVFCVDGCTEPFDAPEEDFEEILVIDALITSEEKRQEIHISNTFLFGSTLQTENGAVVSISDDTGNNFVFSETEPGTYVSDVIFGAQPGVSYSLSVNTSNGNSFRAGPLSISQDAVLESVRGVRSTSENGQEGVAILATGFDAEGEAVFYRYDYEETFQVVSVANPSFDLVVVSETPPILERVPKTREESVCYRTQLSNEISIATSENLSESRVQDFQVRFLPKTAFELRSRYSILVNQYVQSQTAQTFYEDLRDFSNIRTVFAQTQPGFIKGNILAENTNGTRVLGLFEVAQVSSQRIFLEYDDFFSENDPPEFIRDCPTEQYPLSSPILFELIKSGTHKYRGEEPTPSAILYIVSPRGCIDCTVYGTTEIPDFWED